MAATSGANVPAKGRTTAMMSAIGASTRRDQWRLRAKGRVVAVLDTVLPALSVEQVDCGDDPHGVVAVPEQGHGSELGDCPEGKKRRDHGPGRDDEPPAVLRQR